MFLDHLTRTATNNQTEPDRLERFKRVHGDVMALAGLHAGARLVEKVSGICEHKGTLIVFRGETPSESETAHVGQAWASKSGDGSAHVKHAL